MNTNEEWIRKHIRSRPREGKDQTILGGNGRRNEMEPLVCVKKEKFERSSALEDVPERQPVGTIGGLQTAVKNLWGRAAVVLRSKHRGRTALGKESKFKIRKKLAEGRKR